MLQDGAPEESGFEEVGEALPSIASVQRYLTLDYIQLQFREECSIYSVNFCCKIKNMTFDSIKMGTWVPPNRGAFT